MNINTNGRATLYASIYPAIEKLVLLMVGVVQFMVVSLLTLI